MFYLAQYFFEDILTTPQNIESKSGIQVRRSFRVNNKSGQFLQTPQGYQFLCIFTKSMMSHRCRINETYNNNNNNNKLNIKIFIKYEIKKK